MKSIGKSRWMKRRRAVTDLERAFEQPDSLMVIHYSCEDFNNPKGISPRITSIAVRNFASGQTHSFSLHLIADREGIALNSIEQHYDRLESQMLREFFQFVGRNMHARWIHWNMRDANFGFPALEHRARVLGVVPEIIPDDRKVDLARTLIDLFGSDYAEHQRLPSLMALNDITGPGFLTGPQEAEAFSAREWAKLHQSTLRKVDVLVDIADRTVTGLLRTQANWWQRNGASILGVLETVTDSWLVRVAGVIAIFVTIWSALTRIVQGG